MTDDSDHLPARLSPSRASDFQQCPAKFYFKSIVRLPAPATLAQTKGVLAHSAFEQVFQYPKGERTPEAAVAFVRPAWEELSKKDSQAAIVALDVEEIEAFLCETEDAVRAWFGVEDPNRFDPHANELRLEVDVDGVPLIGLIDRVDRIKYPSGNVRTVISDYKTGKVPRPDDRFLAEKFFGMDTYAVMLNAVTGEVPYSLRLVYVIGGTPDAVRTKMCDEALLSRQRTKLKTIWSNIKRCAKDGVWPVRRQTLCQWCEYQSVCPAWVPELAGSPKETLVEIHSATLPGAPPSNSDTGPHVNAAAGELSLFEDTTP